MLQSGTYVDKFSKLFYSPNFKMTSTSLVYKRPDIGHSQPSLGDNVFKIQTDVCPVFRHLLTVERQNSEVRNPKNAENGTFLPLDFSKFWLSEIENWTQTKTIKGVNFFTFCGQFVSRFRPTFFHSVGWVDGHIFRRSKVANLNGNKFCVKKSWL